VLVELVEVDVEVEVLVELVEVDVEVEVLVELVEVDVEVVEVGGASVVVGRLVLVRVLVELVEVEVLVSIKNLDDGLFIMLHSHETET
jgi:hypothetical protein